MGRDTMNIITSSYIYIYIYMCMYVCIYIYRYIRIFVHIIVHTHTKNCINVHAVYVHVIMYVRTLVCMDSFGSEACPDLVSVRFPLLARVWETLGPNPPRRMVSLRRSSASPRQRTASTLQSTSFKALWSLLDLLDQIWGILKGS